MLSFDDVESTLVHFQNENTIINSKFNIRKHNNFWVLYFVNFAGDEILYKIFSLSEVKYVDYENKRILFLKDTEYE